MSESKIRETEIKVKKLLARDAEMQAAADQHLKAILDPLKGQLLIVMVARLGGEVRIPVAEIDATGTKLLSMRVDGDAFVFTVGEKH